MAIVLPSVPAPPAPTVQRFTADGLPTTAQVEYETRVIAFNKAIKRALENL